MQVEEVFVILHAQGTEVHEADLAHLTQPRAEPAEAEAPAAVREETL